jgi:hypothetical protein
MPVAAVVEEL